MDARGIHEIKPPAQLDEAAFCKLIIAYRTGFLVRENYFERLRLHRHPLELKSEILRKLYDYSAAMQNRAEMRQMAPDGKALKPVTTWVLEGRDKDKRIRTLYAAVQAFCGWSRRDPGEVATLVAEFRAVCKLISKFQRETMIRLEENASRPFTFEDWLAGSLYKERTYSGQYVANDSERMLDLVAMGKMPYDELNKIQDAQQQAYDYLIANTLRLSLQRLSRQTKETLDFNQLIGLMIQEVSKYFTDHPELYKQILLPKKHRGGKWGAKFLLPEHYRATLDQAPLDVFNIPKSSYELNIEGRLTAFPTEEQLQYAIMEVNVKWFRILHNYNSRLRYDKMQSVKNFKELIDTYGRGQELVDAYWKGLEFAPDKEIYIRTRISNYESVLPIYKASVGAWDEEYKNEIAVELGEFRRIGYAWVNNGHNASHDDLRGITFRNASLGSSLGPEDRYQIYCHVLYELACGGALAFHMAFLRDQLRNEGSSKNARRSSPPFWQGSAHQKDRLFTELSMEGFLDGTLEDNNRFMNNQPVRWKADGRSLLYLLTRLREKPYRMLTRDEHLGPLIAANFRNKEDQLFKNISQNMNGMFNANKGGKPRLAGKIDEILQKVLGT